MDGLRSPPVVLARRAEGESQSGGRHPLRVDANGGAARILGNRSAGIVDAQEPGGRGLPQERPCERLGLFCGDRHAQRSARSAQCLEGSELAILQAFDFADYDIIKIIQSNTISLSRAGRKFSACSAASYCRNSTIGMRNARYSTDEPPKVYARERVHNASPVRLRPIAALERIAGVSQAAFDAGSAAVDRRRRRRYRNVVDLIFIQYRRQSRRGH